MESRRFPSETEGEGGTFLVRYDLLFLLNSLVVLTFCLKKCLTTLKVVMSMTYTYSSSERSPECLFKEVFRLRGTVSKRYISYSNGDVCLDLTDRGKRLGLVDWAIILWYLVGRGLLSGAVGPKPTVPTMPLFFLPGRAIAPAGKRKRT